MDQTSHENQYRAWLADALSSGEMGIGLVISDKELLNSFVTRFNQEIDATIQQHGKDTVAASIWLIYGASLDTFTCA